MVKNVLLDSKVIAIAGLSPNPTKDSNMVARYLKNNGYKIIPVYPSEDMILDSKVYRNISDVLMENDVEIVVVFRKSEAAFDIAKEIVDNIKYAKNLKLLWLQLGIINDEIGELLKPYDINVIQDRCIKIEHQLLLD